MIWNETKECMDRGQLRELQSARLRKQVANVYYNVPYYRKKCSKLGWSPATSTE